MKKKRNILKGVILCAFMALLLAVPQKNVDAAAKASKEVGKSWVKSGSYSVRVKSGKLYKKGTSKAIDSKVYCAYVSGNTVVYSTYKTSGNETENGFKTYNLKTKKKKTFYKDGGEQGGLYMKCYNNGYAYAVTLGEAQKLYKVNIKTGKEKLVKLGKGSAPHLMADAKYKNYLILGEVPNWQTSSMTLYSYDTLKAKKVKIATKVIDINIIGSKIYYAVAGTTAKDGTCNATIYRCSVTGTGKKVVAKLKNVQAYSLAFNKTTAMYRNANEKLVKYTYSSKKTASCSNKTYNKAKKAMGRYY